METPRKVVFRTLADKMELLKLEIANDVTNEFFRKHSDWLTKYGEAGKKRGVEDACFHIESLSGAIAANSVGAFENYSRWAARVLKARRIDPVVVAENLNQIGQSMSTHLNEAERNIVTKFVEAGTAAIASPEAHAVPPLITNPLSPTRNLFQRALLNGNRQAAINIAFEALSRDVPIMDLYVDVLQEVLREIGRLWEANIITVADEHRATAIAQYVVAQVYSKIPSGAGQRGNVVISGVQGELHQIGANLVADALEINGWNVCFLGTHLPDKDVIASVSKQSAKVLGISVAMLFNLSKVRGLIDGVRSQLGTEAPRIIVGGAAFRVAPESWTEIAVAVEPANFENRVQLVPSEVAHGFRAVDAAPCFVRR